jgi:hypothetical protein
MIIIKSPRYRDRTVLLARYRLPCGQDVKVKITEGAYKGVYKVSNDIICNSPIEGMETKQGKIIAMRAIPLDAMERVE